MKKNSLVSRIYHQRSNPGFTLMELLIVVALLVILATALLISLNPFGQINKGQDSKRKSELASLGKVLEDWYNDKNCYPKASEICYDSADATSSCHVCGNQTGSPSFSPYLSSLPCDPRQPVKKYLYQNDGSSCPAWYIVYTSLSNNSDPVIAEVGCQNGCGPAGNVNYNYFVSSSNIILQGGIGPTSSLPVPTSTTSPQNPTITSTPGPSPTSGPSPTPTSTPVPPTPTPTISYPLGEYVCCDINSLCQSCGNHDQCVNDPGCRSDTEIYLSGSVTCHNICQR